MQLEKIKNKINNKIGSNVKVVYNGSRNKIDEYKGVIKEAYSYIFIVKLITDEVKSFSYSDVLTKTIEVFFE